MIGEGAEAPAVALPAYADGERTRIDLGEHLGEEIVVLAFYPADFNPACTRSDADVGDLDLFTMQKDVSVFCVSPDSTFSHAAFADRYGLGVPLLSDVDGEAAERYGVGLEDGGEHLCQRAVFVIDHRGEVRYAWATADLEERPDVGPVKAAVGDIADDRAAVECYRQGYERYADGRDAFERATAAYEERDWLDARAPFADAEAGFADAADRFDSAVRFAEAADFERVAERSEEKAATLRRAAEWFAQSAGAFADGNGASGDNYREDARDRLSAAEPLPEPPAPDRVSLEDGVVVLDDDVPVDGGPAERSGDGLEIDDGDLDVGGAADGDFESGEDAVGGVDGDIELDVGALDEADGVSERADAPVDGAAGAAGSDGGAGESGEAGRDVGDGESEDEPDDEPIELDLADPTESGDEEDGPDWNIPGR